MSFDVIIIGGGIHGSATAYHLAQAGLKPLVLEKDYVGRHASGVNAGGVRLLGRDEVEISLSRVAMARWQTLDEELGGDTGFRRRSLINIASDDADMRKISTRINRLAELGYDHEVQLNQQELRERLPHVAQDCVGGVVSELDGYAIPYKSTSAYRRAAERIGAKFHEGEAVQSLRQIGEGWQVRTDKGTYDAGVLVNCSGAWADKTAVMMGDNTPMSYSAPMLMITARMPHFAGPVVGAISRQLSFKQFENGTVLIGGGAKGFADRETNTTRLDYAKLAAAAETTKTFFPIMKEAVINRMWAGLEAYMPDNLPVIGAGVNAKNAYHAFGFSAHGFQLGPIVGDVLTQLITTGKSTWDLNAFRIDRFDRKVL
ncbi:FAD-binding oxidoreductase [Pseudovibrio sp. Tun.PSC04-5.I4]|uniref:NAD(P)/FAD-dependent oxidoreductase n=1 Tax=Pseudovibrio sp. Tun.PSC04-5.I4 TaxID=1798213 RepID=UPI00088D1379|nr:FAD-binding oxidoreductase [Pseudovibrio sp. Tun.PSC04-5.I4]SDQ24157.1 sarcosine oxidase subunit beta [Pseudovibrio sp. Tun.PSC04-5.I4]